jgi:hypothetical protein
LFAWLILGRTRNYWVRSVSLWFAANLGDTVAPTFVTAFNFAFFAGAVLVWTFAAFFIPSPETDGF